MPAKSKAQQKAAGDRSVGQGDKAPKSKLKGASKSMSSFDERERAQENGVDEAQG